MSQYLLRSKSILKNVVITVNIPQQDIKSTNYRMSFSIIPLRTKLSFYFSVLNASNYIFHKNAMPVLVKIFAMESER